jgi:hypothetical protein
MKRLKRTITGFLLVFLLGLAPVLNAAEAKPSTKPANPGAELSAAISQITGIAISPLLGMGAVGAYKWFKADGDAAKAKLPWFAQPWFWLPALLVVGACFTKDSFGTVVPTALKKPLDVVEVFENKISGLIATGAIVPLALTVFESFEGDSSASLSQAGFAAINSAPILNYLMVPVAITIFAIVWVVSHTINILILISPFSTVDAALKGFRTAILASVVGSNWLPSTLGIMWCGLIILVCALLAGWAFRLMIFGHVFAWDILTFRRRRTKPEPSAVWCFAARKFAGVPIRTYGRLNRTDSGMLTFSYRPFLVLPARTVELAGGRYSIGRGAFHPEILHIDQDGEPDIFDLPPRFRSHEESVAGFLKLEDVRDVGLRAAWNWFKSLLGGDRSPA